MDSIEREMTLLSVELEDPIANSPKGIAFREAVNNDDMNAAYNVFIFGDNELKKYCGKYLISLESSRLVKPIKDAYIDPKCWSLQVILIHAEQPFLDKAFAEFEPSNGILRRVVE